MKLLRFGPLGQEKPGLLDGEGRIRDLSAHVDDIAGEALTPEGLARIAALDAAALPLVGGAPRLGACVGRVGKFICIGLCDVAIQTAAGGGCTLRPSHRGGRGPDDIERLKPHIPDLGHPAPADFRCGNGARRDAPVRQLIDDLEGATLLPRRNLLPMREAMTIGKHQFE